MASTTTELIDSGTKVDGRGRRIVTPQEREALIAAYRRSGMTQHAFAQREAIIYSLIVSCCRRCIDPLAYLRDIPTQLPAMTTRDDLTALPPVLRPRPESVSRRERRLRRRPSSALCPPIFHLPSSILHLRPPPSLPSNPSRDTLSGRAPHLTGAIQVNHGVHGYRNLNQKARGARATIRVSKSNTTSSS